MPPLESASADSSDDDEQRLPATTARWTSPPASPPGSPPLRSVGITTSYTVGIGQYDYVYLQKQ